MSEEGSEADIAPRHFNVAEVPATDMLAYAPRPALEVGVKAGYAPAAALDLSGREASKRPPAPLDAARDLADEPHGLSADEARRAPSAQRAGTHRSGVVSRLMPRLPQPLIEEVLSPY